MPSSKSKLVTLFWDLTPEDELRLRDHFNRTFVPTIRLNERVKSVKFEFITEDLVTGKVLGKKAYEVRVPTVAENSILNSKIQLDRLVVINREGRKEYRIEWPTFYFMNPDKITVKVKELRKKQRKEGWRGKAFKSIFWDWDGAVTLRVVIETEDGKVGYYDILRIMFVYKGNASAALAWANEKRRKYKRRINAILDYIAGVYSIKVKDLVRQYIDIYMNYRERDRRLKLNLIMAALADELEGNRRAIFFVKKMIDTIIRLRQEINMVTTLMNRSSGARFLVLVDYRKAYNPILTNKNNELVTTLVPLRFYSEIKAGRVMQEDRWHDQFGNQYFMIVRKDKVESELKWLALKISEIVGTYSMDKKFRPIGKLGFLNHEIRVSGVPPKDITVEKVEQAEIDWLWRNVKIRRPRTRIIVAFARSIDKEYVVYVIEPIDRAGRYTVLNYDHHDEGKDRVVAHIPVGKTLVFIHKL